MRRDKLAPGRPEARRARAARATHRCPAPLPLLSLQPVALFSQLFLRASTQAEAKGCLVPCPLNRTPSTQLPFRGPVHRKATGFHSGRPKARGTHLQVVMRELRRAPDPHLVLHPLLRVLQLLGDLRALVFCAGTTGRLVNGGTGG